MPTNIVTASLATISQYMWGVQCIKDNNLGTGSINTGRDRLLYINRKIFQYGISQSLSGLNGINQYVYHMIGAKLKQAQEIYSNGSGGVVPSPSGAGYILPFDYYHVVTSGEANSTSLTDVLLKNVSGVVTLFVNQQPFQLNVGFTFSSNTTNGTINFDLSPGNVYTLQTGDVITFNATQTVTP